MIHDEIHFMLKQFEQNIMMQGVNLQQFMQITGKTEEQLHKEYEEPAKKRVMHALILNEIAKLEGIEVTEEEIETEIPVLALNYQIPVEEIKKLDGLKDAIKSDLKTRKIFNLLLENN